MIIRQTARFSDLIKGLPRAKVDHEQTDIFREHVQYFKKFKTRLAEAREKGLDALRRLSADPEVHEFAEVEMGILVDVFLAYRDVRAYDDMIAVYESMPEPLKRTRIVQEQRAFALDRLGRRQDAERVLRELITSHGPAARPTVCWVVCTRIDGRMP